MTPVIVALYDDYAVAERVRTQLVEDGFPTDRVELTSRQEAGQADAQPGSRFGEKLEKYFQTLFEQTDTDQASARPKANEFAQAVRQGGSAITVHPRTDYELDSARSILKQHSPAKFNEVLH